MVPVTSGFLPLSTRWAQTAVPQIQVPGAPAGLRAQAKWRPAGGGLGSGSGVLFDVQDEIGRVSISVIPVPFPPGPKAEPAGRLAPASN